MADEALAVIVGLGGAPSPSSSSSTSSYTSAAAAAAVPASSPEYSSLPLSRRLVVLKGLVDAVTASEGLGLHLTATAVARGKALVAARRADAEDEASAKEDARLMREKAAARETKRAAEWGLTGWDVATGKCSVVTAAQPAPKKKTGRPASSTNAAAVSAAAVIAAGIKGKVVGQKGVASSSSPVPPPSPSPSAASKKGGAASSKATLSSSPPPPPALPSADLDASSGLVDDLDDEAL